MSNHGLHDGCVKNIKTTVSYVRVKLEPELEAIASAWGPVKRIQIGVKFLRWGRQLIISGKIIASDVHAKPRRSGLRRVALRKAVFN